MHRSVLATTVPLRGVIVALGVGGVLLAPVLTFAAVAAPVTTAVSVTVSATASHPYQTVTATATVTPAAATGTVTFTRTSTVLCSARTVTAGKATCTVTPTSTSPAGAVTAVFTPADPTAQTSGRGTSPALTVSTYPVTVKAAYTDSPSGGCTQRTVSVTVTRAGVTGPAPQPGLPRPGGAVSVAGSNAIPVHADGAVTACVGKAAGAPVVTYSGDTRYASGRTTASETMSPNHTRTGSVGPGVGGSAPSGLAATGSAHVGELLGTAAALLMSGFVFLGLGRRRRATG